MEDLYSHVAHERHDGCMKAADRVTFGQREAAQLARLMRSRASTPLSVPTVEDDAVHHLTRTRKAVLLALKAAKFRPIQTDRQWTHHTASWPPVAEEAHSRCGATLDRLHGSPSRCTVRSIALASRART